MLWKKCENMGRKCGLTINNDDHDLVSGALVSESVELNIPNGLLPPCID